MLARSQYEFRKLLMEQGIMFCYSGYMTEKILTGIGQAIKHKLALDDADTRTVRGVFAIFVEQMQNVIRYSAERERLPGPENSVLSYGVLSVGQEDGHFFVTCSNKILNEDVSRLDNHLSEIRGMDREQLKVLYKRILKGDVPEGSKGAGVGFVDIARTASRPIEFEFIDIDEQHAFFSLKAYI